MEGRSSLVWLEHPFIVPGGRFREVYYWDTLWTVKGLLRCGMVNTTRGMVENFKHLIGQFSMIPNGNR